MSASNNSYIQLLTNISIYASRYVSPVLFVLGNIGNVICFLIFFKRSWRKNVCVFYFMTCLILETISLNSNVIGVIMGLGFNINAQNSNRILCKLFYYVSYLTSIYLPVVLILASIDRLLISSQDVDTRLYSSKRLAYFTISTSLSIWILFTLHILITVDLQEIYPRVFICYYNLSKWYQDFFSYSTTILVLLPSTILLIISLLSFKNVRHIRAIPREKRNQVRSMTKKDFQLIRCLYVYDIVYILSFLVSLVGTFFGIIYPLQQQTAIQAALETFFYNFGSCIHFTALCASFFIFISVSKAFRQEFKRFSYRLCCRDINIIQEENQPQELVERENNRINNDPIKTIESCY